MFLLETRGQLVDPAGDVVVGPFERLSALGEGRVRNGPVQWLDVEVFVGAVTDGDHQLVAAEYVGGEPWPGRGEVEAVPTADGHGTWMDAVRGMRAAGDDRDVADGSPVRLGELGAGGVLRAQERDPVRLRETSGTEQLVAGPGTRDVGAAPVALGPPAQHQAGILQHAQVVCDQVGGKAQRVCQFPRCQVGVRKAIDDGKAGRVAECCVGSGPRCKPAD